MPKTQKTAKPSKPKADDVAAQIQGMQQELVDLQRSLAQLLDALIAEEKPGPKEIRKIQSLKEQALKGEHAIAEATAKPTKAKPKRKKKVVKEAATEQATFDQ